MSSIQDEFDAVASIATIALVGRRMAQTFTPSNDITLTRIDLKLMRSDIFPYESYPAPGPCTLEIYPTVGGVPDTSGAAIASTVRSANGFPSWYPSFVLTQKYQSFTFSTNPRIKLTGGIQYCVVVIIDDPDIVDGSVLVLATNAGGGKAGEHYYQSSNGGAWASGTAGYDIIYKIWGLQSSTYNAFRWPAIRDDDYDPDWFWNDSTSVFSNTPIELAGLQVGAGYQNNIVAVGADPSTGEQIIYYGIS